MPPLSVAIVARDEVDRLPDAIRSVSAIAAEVVVLDSGSTDGSVEAAQALGARVIRCDWPGYIAQKNRALEQVAHDWVLCIDADERLSPRLAESISTAMSGEPKVAGFRVNRLSTWQGAPLRYGTWHPDWRVRLFRRDRARWGGREPHDRVALTGNTGDLAGELLHDPYRDLGEHLATIGRYSALAAAALSEEGTRAHAWDLLLRPPAHLFRALVLRRGLLDGARGLCVAGLGASYVLLKWTRLWLAQHGHPDSLQIVDKAQSESSKGRT